MRGNSFEGRRQQLRGILKSIWGKITCDELLRVEGEKTRMIGALQVHYGYGFHDAQQEVEMLCRRFGRRRAATPS
jgi:uncharacterized protein YjbJ (UPF0337 family)